MVSHITLVQILIILIVFGVLIEEVFRRDDGTVPGVSALNDFGVVQSHVFHAVANDIRMYRPLATLACMHLRDVRERHPASCTVAQVFHSLVPDLERSFFFLGYPLFFR